MTTRKLFLEDEVSSSSVSKIIKDIIAINEEDSEKEKTLKDYKRSPIYLIINSPGGLNYDGLALIDIIEASKTPVYTICVGKAMSMAFLIFLAGEKRFLGKHATLLYHSVSFGVQSDISKVDAELTEAKRLDKINKDYILKKTKIKAKTLEHYDSLRQDWYITVPQALKLKIADGILEK